MATHIPYEQLAAIAQQYGTPVYVYNANVIKEQYATISKAFSMLDTQFFYASKALTNVNVIKYIAGLGCGIDCSSINEVKLALHAGVLPAKILYTSNGISFSEIQEAVALGVHVNIDSLSNLEKFARHYGSSYPVGVRLRPNILAGGNLKISTGHEKSKFGIPIDQLDELKNIVHTYSVNLRVLHIHTGSDIKDADVFVNGIKVLGDIVPLFPTVQVIDLGGGFKVPYEPHGEETNVSHIANRLNEFLTTHFFNKGRTLSLWFEPGKYLVSQCGYLVTRVNVMKYSHNVTFAGVDTGLNHLIRPMFYDAYHHIENISNPQGDEYMYTVTGNICETDTFAQDRVLNEVREGDLLVFHNAGAYGFEMASNYNSRFKPAEVLVENEQPRLIRRRDNFDDLLRNQVLD